QRDRDVPHLRALGPLPPRPAAQRLPDREHVPLRDEDDPAVPAGPRDPLLRGAYLPGRRGCRRRAGTLQPRGVRPNGEGIRAPVRGGPPTRLGQVPGRCLLHRVRHPRRRRPDAPDRERPPLPGELLGAVRDPVRGFGRDPAARPPNDVRALGTPARGDRGGPRGPEGSGPPERGRAVRGRHRPDPQYGGRAWPRVDRGRDRRATARTRPPGPPRLGRRAARREVLPLGAPGRARSARGRPAGGRVPDGDRRRPARAKAAGLARYLRTGRRCVPRGVRPGPLFPGSVELPGRVPGRPLPGWTEGVLARGDRRLVWLGGVRSRGRDGRGRWSSRYTGE